jgi:hypothetical protein
MALIRCKECGKEINKSASLCPYCGFKCRRTSMLTWILAALVALPVLRFIAFGPSTSTSQPVKQETPEQIAAKKKKDEAVQRATVGAVTLKKAMRNPESFKLESAIVVDGTGAVCYSYRAQNGFGGTNVGRAVLSRDGKQFKTNEMNGFATLWNKECGDKSGTDAATAIRWFAL